ncbi:MAG: MoaD/ThiS family protein [Desulfovibrionaceae bacterium]|nr:MoaD/ThiS family protein [Desulfovibrionaceae bacterium]MBF0513139.1 MoaD/ThiS family protein [Desulfovibrionaceae bacterium]
MRVTLKCFATLGRFQPENAADFPLKPPETVERLIARLGIPEEEVAVVFVNGVHAPRETLLADGDRVGLFPAVGGG